MRFQKKRSFLIAVLILVLAFTGCSVPKAADSNVTDETEAITASNTGGVVNLYTDRHYDTDDTLFAQFTEETGITVNVVKGKSDELIERLKTEGQNTEADLFITADAGRLHRAKISDLLSPVTSDILTQNIPENYRDKENFWFGITKRARVLVYAKDRVQASELSTYEALTDSKWKGRVLTRSSENIYTQSLLASMIALNGEEAANQWAAGIVANLARAPKGGDRDQAKAIAAGEGDIAIMNTYYLGQMLNSTDEEERKVAEQLAVFFPNQESTGTHVNVSGVALVKASKNTDNAIKLMEFLSSESAQRVYAETNYEYPVNPNVSVSELLLSWGDFKAQTLHLSLLGENNEAAVILANEVGWK